MTKDKKNISHSMNVEYKLKIEYKIKPYGMTDEEFEELDWKPVKFTEKLKELNEGSEWCGRSF